ncbi:EAL domain-containing protein [Massilia sp. YIM B02769]|uniref:sensor domain-containing protein n=1 Tax=Massilia sp. YIM B02769 TaxID=3050129 RepID=UPI0025B6531C|nr:GGDEF and EAL domain-containing protein [Massilia sp. YIM B02769]MDN4060009.1 EAL domain-containing protein [Massilia sp. YIM B02769]
MFSTMFRIDLRALPARLGRLYSRSIYGALIIVVVGGLVVPALAAGYLLLAVQERRATVAELDATLQRNAEILALGIQESLWNMNTDAARSLVDSVMRDPSVVRIQVRGVAGSPADTGLIDAHAPARPLGRVLRAERQIVVRGQPIGQVTIEMDDLQSEEALHRKQFHYALVLAVQVVVSLALILTFLRRRLHRPLRTLAAFSDRLSRGDFDTPLALEAKGELARLGRQMERMRTAIRALFVDIARREEQFRTIVNQVPGAVFRAHPGGPIEFVSDAIEEISGYPAERLMRGSTEDWSNIVCPEDRRLQRRITREAIHSGRSYEIEYRIVDAHGLERWVLESGQPQGRPGDPDFRVDGIISDISERKHNEMRIEALLVEQGAILDNVMFGVVFTRERRIVSTNRRAEDLFGYPDGSLVGQPASRLFVSQDEHARAEDVFFPILARGADARHERQMRRRDGSLLWCLVSGSSLVPGHPEAGNVWVFADISERKEAEEELALSATVIAHIADGVMVTDTCGTVVAVNPAFTTITGYTEAEAIGQPWDMTRSSRHDDAFYTNLAQELQTGGFWRGEVWSCRKDGEVFLEWLTVSAVRNSEGVLTHYVGVFSDITRLKESQEQLDFLAHHDPLTSLPNRLLFQDRLLHAIGRAAREAQQLAVMFVDLDRFKNVNDTLGHQVGDQLLKEVASALHGRLREGDTLARLGGDEFVVLLEHVDGQYGATQVAQKLVALFEQPFMVSNHELFVTGSIGIALYPQDAQDANLLIRHADVAMYGVKSRGRNGYQFYSPAMDGEGVERLRMEALLRRAIERHEIFLHYQPQVEIDSGRLIGVEALVRWHHPELGAVSPARFIPMAEDSGFINQLGEWVLNEACRQMGRWDALGLQVPKMAVNLSVRQVERGAMAPLVARVLGETGLAPRRLQLEVTESVIMNTGDAAAFIGELHGLGVGLAIDDFGTGYSSLAYLKQLPVDVLKIDRSFIKDIPADADDEAIAIAIIQLGKSMNLSVIAEGVENEQQAAFLLRHGCTRAQGFLYGRPVGPEALLADWGQNTHERQSIHGETSS